MEEIDRLAKSKPWQWIVTFHPKLDDPKIVEGYKRIARENENVEFFEGPDKFQLLRKADVMLCDSRRLFWSSCSSTSRSSRSATHIRDHT